MFNPHQRGTLNGYANVAANDCGLTSGPCGGRAYAAPVSFVPRGQNFTVAFTKNLDHFNSAKPGSFVADWSDTPDAANWKTLGSVADTNSPSLTNYLLHVQLPSAPVRHGVLRMRYITNNPNAPAVFYQCADLGLE